jgi:hypothetical protein
MNSKALCITIVGALTLAGCASHAVQPRPLVARTQVNGLTRLQTHHLLANYCTTRGFGIVHDSLSALACSKRLDGAPKSHLAEPLNTRIEPFTPELTLHFRFVPDHAGVMRIQATGSMVRRGHGGYVERSAAPVGEVQAMLNTSRDAWYAKHPQLAPAKDA